MRKAAIKMQDELAGWLKEDENGYHFQYRCRKNNLQAKYYSHFLMD